MNCVAIIPARGGSKRIPGKNLKPFFGKPIIAYSIEAVIKSGLFDRVIVLELRLSEFQRIGCRFDLCGLVRNFT